MATWPRADVGDSRYEPTGRRAVSKMKACPQWSDADDWTYFDRLQSVAWLSVADRFLCRRGAIDESMVSLG